MPLLRIAEDRCAHLVALTEEDCFDYQLVDIARSHARCTIGKCNWSSIRSNKNTRQRRSNTYEHNQNQRWNRDLLQGLGPRAGRDVLARLAIEFGRLGWTNAFPRAAR